MILKPSQGLDSFSSPHLMISRPSPDPDHPEARPRPRSSSAQAEAQIIISPQGQDDSQAKPRQRSSSAQAEAQIIVSPRGQDDSQAKPRQRSSSSQAQAQVILRPGPASPYCILRTEPDSVFKRHPGPIVVSEKAGLAWATSQFQARQGASVLPWCSYE